MVASRCYQNTNEPCVGHEATDVAFANGCHNAVARSTWSFCQQSYPMFDAEYFRRHFTPQVERIGAGSCSGAIFLNTGHAYNIKEIHEATDDYLLLAIYPFEATDTQATRKALDARKKDSDGLTVHDVAAISYGSISHIVFTSRDNSATPIGFTS